MRRFGLATMTALALIGLGLSIAQETDQPPGRRFALLVAVKKYKASELKSLKWTENDVDGLAKVLRDSGYRRVVVMTQTTGAKDPDLLPTADQIRSNLSSMLEDCREQDSFVVAFSGHGVQFKGEQEHYFCPHGAELSKRATLVPLTEIYAALNACKARHKLLLVDACRNDPQSDLGKSAQGDRLESVTRPQRVPPPGGVAALFSCSEGQRSFESDELEHGLFFHAVLQGLKGEAANKNGEVGLAGLAQYVQDEVPLIAKEKIDRGVRQVPELKTELRGAMVLLSREKSKELVNNPVVNEKESRPTTSGAESPSEFDAPASAKDVAAAVADVVLAARRNGEAVNVGIWLTAPVTKGDVNRLRNLKEGVQASKAYVEEICVNENQDSRVLLDAVQAAFDGKAWRPRIYRDGRGLLASRDVDALVLVGPIRAQRIEEIVHLGNASGASVLDTLVEVGCESGKDTFITGSKAELSSWWPKRDEQRKPYQAARKYNRIVWTGSAAKDFEEFFKCVRSRSKGNGDITR